MSLCVSAQYLNGFIISSTPNIVLEGCLGLRNGSQHSREKLKKTPVAYGPYRRVPLPASHMFFGHTTSSPDFKRRAWKIFKNRDLDRFPSAFCCLLIFQITVSRSLKNRPSQPSHTPGTIQDITTQNEDHHAAVHGYAHCGPGSCQSSGETQQQPVAPQGLRRECHQRPLDRLHTKRWEDRPAVVCEGLGGHPSSGIASLPWKITDSSRISLGHLANMQ